VSPWALAGLGLQFCVAIVMFVYLGNWLDRRLDTAPLFLLGGVLVGGGGTFYSGYRRVIAPKARNTDSTDSEST
jgi:F0F1-type ATP synthase assembly protein I